MCGEGWCVGAAVAAVAAVRTGCGLVLVRIGGADWWCGLVNLECTDSRYMVKCDTNYKRLSATYIDFQLSIVKYQHRICCTLAICSENADTWGYLQVLDRDSGRFRSKYPPAQPKSKVAELQTGVQSRGLWVPDGRVGRDGCGCTRSGSIGGVLEVLYDVLESVRFVL